MKFFTWLKQMFGRPFQKFDEYLTRKAEARAREIIEREDEECARNVISRIPYGR